MTLKYDLKRVNKLATSNLRKMILVKKLGPRARTMKDSLSMKMTRLEMKCIHRGARICPKTKLMSRGKSTRIKNRCAWTGLGTN